MEKSEHPFVEYLEGLREDRGALAALRRGLGQPPGTVADMYRYVVPWLPASARPREEAVYYLVAALFGSHPAEGGTGNMGEHFARTCESGSDNTAIERRFTALLAAHPDDLGTYLRQAISFLRSKDVPVEWHQLFQDLQRWGYDNRPVQRKWAGAFWGRPQENQTKKE
jgi:CRISPR type I-E-associated protein CasB/Cse2